MFKKRGKPIERRGKHINDFRTDDYRVFYAAPYFDLDLWYEIGWHKKHLKKLKNHAINPHLFYQQYTNSEITEQRKKHFQEHVLDSIPFHKKILEENEKRLKTILHLMPKRKYKKIVNISKEYGGTPEFFVYDKTSKEFFFVAEHLDDTKKHWIGLVKDVHEFCDVVVLK